MVEIRKVAVLGSGIMGSGIAAQLASCGLDVHLVDIAPEGADDPNGIAKANLKAALKARPAGPNSSLFYDPAAARRIRPCHYDEDGACLRDCDLIIEVVTERIDIKSTVFDYVEKHGKPEAIIASNTSGIPLAALCEGRPESFQKRFLITHFFNPVRYLHLVELVPGNCDEDRLQAVRKLLEDDLGKGVVICKDSPNFIANRIGVYGMMATMRRMEDHGLGFDEVDAVVGKPMGRPGSAAFGTADLVGIDVLSHAAQTVYDRCPEDEERDLFKAPDWLRAMVAEGRLGNKAGRGFFRRGKVLFLHGLEGSPKGSKAKWLKKNFKGVTPKLDVSTFEAAVASAKKAIRKERPSIIVGSSFGGAVLLELMHTGDFDGFGIFLAQAGLKLTNHDRLPEGAHAVIIHGTGDDIIPIEDSRQLAQNSGLELMTLDDDHRLLSVLSEEVLGKLLVEAGLKPGGGRSKLVWDRNTGHYRARRKLDSKALKRVRYEDDPAKRLRKLVWAEDDAAAAFAWDVFADTVLYAARRIPEVADSIVEIDQALRWGFNWDLGPFEGWDAVGLQKSVQRMQEEGRSIPDWVLAAAEAGGFYRSEGQDREVFLPETSRYAPLPEDPRWIDLKRLKAGDGLLYTNPFASVIDLGDGVLCVEFHSKMNSLSPMSGEAMRQAMQLADERGDKGIIIGNQGENFSVGADLSMVKMLADAGSYDQIEKLSKDLQDLLHSFRRWGKPVVAAPHGLTLGGGCEVALAADKIVATAETYMGLVEVGAGVIPAGGGCKEMLCRFVGSIPPGVEVSATHYTQAVFKLIGLANVATGGHAARQQGYLRAQDQVCNNRDQQLWMAKQSVLAMSAAGYRPEPEMEFKLPGEDGYAQLCFALYQMRLGGYASAYDETVGKQLAWVLSGGDCGDRPVTEVEILELERKAFVTLCHNEPTMARMESLLTTGRPLRN